MNQAYKLREVEEVLAELDLVDIPPFLRDCR